VTDAQIKALAEGMGNMLLSHAAHGLATSSLSGMGEITLRDALVVAAAAAGSRMRQAWIIDREVVPDDWDDAPVDLLISREGNNGHVSLVGGTELKWWRRADAGNSANRRRDLIKDLFRAAALYPAVSSFSFVALLTTPDSWAATTDTTGSDQDAMRLLKRGGSQSWNSSTLAASAAMKGALRQLKGRVPLCSVFHTELLCSARLSLSKERVATAKVWRVKKPQRSVFMSAERVAELIA
jgi:hypothetical protein